MRRTVFFLAFGVLLWGQSVRGEASEAWREVSPGFSYLRNTETGAHLFKVNPAKWRVSVLRAKDYSQAALSVRRYRERSEAALAINGGFFNGQFESLGLLVQQGHSVSPLRQASWGVFSISGGRPTIQSSRDYNTTDPAVEMAIQAGPRLVVNGILSKLKESLPERRSAIGITPDREVLLAVTDNPLLMTEWAKLLQVYATDVLNLDGGGSTQLSVKLKNLTIQVDGETNVPNAVALFPH